tara:strand:+ start:1956 stop:2183 length:228 start_codon:yes stop_codon:yes gene_type:complete
MSKFTITLEDDADEVKLYGQVEPEITPDKIVFSTAEIIGLYMQSNMNTIMRDAISWAKTPDEKSPSKIILPGAQL